MSCLSLAHKYAVTECLCVCVCHCVRACVQGGHMTQLILATAHPDALPHGVHTSVAFSETSDLRSQDQSPTAAGMQQGSLRSSRLGRLGQDAVTSSREDFAVAGRMPSFGPAYMNAAFDAGRQAKSQAGAQQSWGLLDDMGRGYSVSVGGVPQGGTSPLLLSEMRSNDSAAHLEDERQAMELAVAARTSPAKRSVHNRAPPAASQQQPASALYAFGEYMWRWAARQSARVVGGGCRDAVIKQKKAEVQTATLQAQVEDLQAQNKCVGRTQQHWQRPVSGQETKGQHSCAGQRRDNQNEGT